MDPAPEPKQAWMPGTALGEDETLEYDSSAYTMYHAIKPEWPCLTFDIVKDGLGTNRTRFPHTMYAVCGTQADEASRNKLTVMKLSDLSKTYKKGDDDESSDEEDGSESSSDEDDTEDDPVLEHVNINHYGGVNRLRCMPQSPHIVATHADTAHVHIWDISTHLASFDSRGASPALQNRQIATHSGHKAEGFAMDWSNVSAGRLVTGDCAGGIHLWNPAEGGGWSVSSGAANSWDVKTSVEDLQWSPSEATVFASGDCSGSIRIFDVRKAGDHMLCSKASDSDINVLGWNRNVNNLLATGSDDGVVSVWDLRSFGQAPLSRFTTHSSAITSLEWHPTDESMLVVSDENAVVIYDLSIEEDAEEAARTAMATAGDKGKIPPQMLFMHCGSQSNKEVHWHPQIPSLVMTTALSGFNIFMPSNL